MLIDRSPKYVAVSREIEALIREGRWRDGAALSARKIAEKHGVSVVTAARALQVLRDRGLIETVDRRGSYLAAAAPAVANCDKLAICFRVTPGPWYQASLAHTRSRFQEMARRHGLVLDTETFDDGSQAVGAGLRRRVRKVVDAGMTGMFLLPS